MLDTSCFEPGTVLWLPKRRDLPFNSLDMVSTVPDRCFGHPALVLAVDSSNSSIIILILTTFSGSGPLPAKIYHRGHDLHEYLPIHPARRHIDGIPSLFLHASQNLVRDNWVYVREPYSCAKAWLQETWDENWLMPHLSRRITTKSLHSLVLYARSKGFDSYVYDGLLQHYGAPDISREAPLWVALPRLTSATDTGPLEPFGRSSHHDRTIQQPGQHSVSYERTTLLPYAVDHRTVVRYGAAKAPKERRQHWLCSLVAFFISCISLCALIFGIGYGVYAGFGWFVALWKYTIWPEVSVLWEKVVNWIKRLL